MTRYKLILFLLLISAIVAACTPAPTATAPATAAPAESATPVPTRRPTTEPVGHTPVPTRDLISDLVTLAYTLVTPAPRSTVAPATATASPRAAVNGQVTPTAPANAVPASAIISEPIVLTNAVNTADCKIRNMGDCTPTMPVGTDLYFTWTFGYHSPQRFTWGNAAVIITRDGQPFVWTQVGNGLKKPPPKDVGWILSNGQTAEFRAGMEDVQPGAYKAWLVMCTLSPFECNDGKGWQEVGGDTINFVITP